MYGHKYVNSQNVVQKFVFGKANNFYVVGRR